MSYDIAVDLMERKSLMTQERFGGVRENKVCIGEASMGNSYKIITASGVYSLWFW